MERELGNVGGSFPFFLAFFLDKILRFRKKSGKVARETELRKLLTRFPLGTHVGQRLFVFFFTGGISPEIEIEN
jgi:hypothetical protein